MLGCCWLIPRKVNGVKRNNTPSRRNLPLYSCRNWESLAKNQGSLHLPSLRLARSVELGWSTCITQVRFHSFISFWIVSPLPKRYKPTYGLQLSNSFLLDSSELAVNRWLQYTRICMSSVNKSSKLHTEDENVLIWKEGKYHRKSPRNTETLLFQVQWL